MNTNDTLHNHKPLLGKKYIENIIIEQKNCI